MMMNFVAAKSRFDAIISTNLLRDIMGTSTITLFVIAGIALLLLTYLVMLYNGFIQIRNNIDKSWSNIDVILKQRHDELSKLIAACKKYMDFEKKLLTDITKARSQVDAARKTGDMKALVWLPCCAKVLVACLQWQKIIQI